jgi:hypothetical protein
MTCKKDSQPKFPNLLAWSFLLEFTLMQFPVEIEAFLGGVSKDRPLGGGYSARIRKSTMVANN